MGRTVRAAEIALCLLALAADAHRLDAQTKHTYHCRTSLSAPGVGRIEACMLYSAALIGQTPSPGMIAQSAGICRQTGGTWAEGCCEKGWKLMCHRPSGVRHYYYAYPAGVPESQCARWRGDIFRPEDLGPDDLLVCQECDPTDEAAVLSVAIETEICEGCVLDARGDSEIALRAEVLLPGTSELTENDVTWSVEHGDGTLSSATGLETVYKHGGSHAGPVTVTARLCDSTASRTIEAAPIVARVTSVDGRDRKVMGFLELRREPLTATVSPRPFDYDPESIRWEVWSGSAARLEAETGEANTMIQSNVLSGHAFDTLIHARYGDNEPGDSFGTSSHRVRARSVHFANNHTIHSDDGEEYVSGWVDGRSPESLPVAFTRNTTAEIGAELEIVPAVPEGTAIEIRAEGMLGALALDPVSVAADGGKLSLPVLPARAPLPDEVLHVPSLSIGFSALFEDARAWVNAGSAVELPVYLIHADPKTEVIYHTPLHIGTTRLASAGSPSNYLTAYEAIFQEFETRHVERVDQPGVALQYWGPRIGELVPRADNPDDLGPAPWAQTAEGLLRKGAGTCNAWSHLLWMTFRIQGFDQFYVFEIGIRREFPAYPGLTGTRFLVANWAPPASGDVPTSSVGIPAQGSPAPTDLEKTFPQHVILGSLGTTRSILFDPSYGTKAIGPIGGKAGLERALRIYEDATIDYYVYQGKLGGVHYKPNTSNPADPMESEMEFLKYYRELDRP